MCTGIKYGVLALIIIAVAGTVFAPTSADSDFEAIGFELPFGLLIVNSRALLQATPPAAAPAPKFLMFVTAYSSSEDETDSTPHITASGTRVRDGVAASNLFAIGTNVKIPQLFGEKVFVIEDRMHERFSDRIDIWMPSKAQALHFGKRLAEIEIHEL